jgi:hypothetical protein
MIKTISVQGYEFKVDFDYNPYEPPERHYPGCNEYVDINEVWSPEGNILEEWAFELIQDDLEIGCLEAVQVDQEEDLLSREQSREDAWEAKHENDLLKCRRQYGRTKRI